MTANRRIFLNIVATYGRSLYALVIGLLCGRWILMSLGHVDYGLLGVVGGMMAFVSVLNGLMASAVGRFFAYSVGAASVDGCAEKGLEECRKWFNTAVTIHTVVPIVSILVGCPIGEYAVRNWLTIPPDRVADCVWIWRFNCITCFVGMTSVPYHAMYTAKQEIAELTLYGFASSTLNMLFVAYMVTHPSAWLVRYAFWTCCLNVVPSLIITCRAFVKYEECRFVRQYMFDWGRTKTLASYAACKFLGAVSSIVSNQGVAILVNKLLGPTRNAAISVGNTVTEHANKLATAFNQAFYPALTNMAGAGRMDKVQDMAMRICVLATSAFAMFAIPLMLETREVLILWLKNPPDGAPQLCFCLLLMTILQQITVGFWMSIYANGKIWRFQLSESICYFSVFLVSWLLIRRGWGVLSVGIGMVFATSAVACVQLCFGRMLCGLGLRLWLRRVFGPLFVVIGLTALCGWLPRMALQESFLRVCLVTCVCEVVFLPLLWTLVFRKEERDFVVQKFSRILGKVRRCG